MAFRLLAITPSALEPERLLEAARAIARPQVAFQLRRPHDGTRALLSLAERLLALGAPVFINGRLDVALSVGGHLHLPAHGVRLADARRVLPPERLLSVAVHDEAEADAAFGADLALVSPVFAPGSKQLDDRPTLGPGGFVRLAARLACPAFALGGLTPANAARVPQASGVAAISALFSAEDPGAAAADFLSALHPPEASNR